MSNNWWFKKEKPLPGMIGMGGGATSLVNSTAGGAGVDSPEGHDASGGVISHYYDPSSKALYRAHTFNAPGNFVVSSLSGTYPAYIDWVIVAPGGGGGQQHSGGGGGGGYVASNLITPYAPNGYPISLSPTPHSPTGGTYPITVGMAGRGDNGWPGPGYGAGTGDLALAFGVMVAGGGAGGSASPTNPAGSNGGGGGGGGAGPTGGPGGEGNKYTANNPSSPGGEGSPSGQGYDGGASTGWGPTGGGGGGGGAGGVGADSQTIPGQAGAGGPGRTDPLAQYYELGPTSPKIYGGGGGGGGHGGALFVGGNGGPGGGGDGGQSPDNPQQWGLSGVNGQGGGGGSAEGGSGPAPIQGGPGGGGCVVARYQIGTAEPGAKATGGSISYYDGKYIHAFESTGVFTTNAGFNETIEYVVIGGGGAGGYQNAGGGGAGGFATGTTPFGTPTATPMAVTIGEGGRAFWSTPPNAATNPGDKGEGSSSSVVFPTGTITAGGGGYGANEPSSPGGQTMPLGSGGGGSRGYPSGSTGGEGGPQGNDGGNGVPGGATQCGAGGGGAGGAGENAQPTRAGGGGIGVQLPATFRNPRSTVGYPGPGPSAWWVCGGGGGGTGNGSGNAGGGGAGPGDPTASPTVFINYAGGGDGRDTATPDATPSPIKFQGSDQGCGRHGKVNTGGGGGGGSDAPAPSAQTRNIGGDGGPGMILIAYPE